MHWLWSHSEVIRSYIAPSQSEIPSANTEHYFYHCVPHICPPFCNLRKRGGGACNILYLRIRPPFRSWFDTGLPWSSLLSSSRGWHFWGFVLQCAVALTPFVNMLVIDSKFLSCSVDAGFSCIANPLWRPWTWQCRSFNEEWTSQRFSRW